jgi:hypothetical protein
MRTPSTAAKVVAVVAAIVFFSFAGYATVGLVTTVPASGDITSQANSGFEVTFEGLSQYPEKPFVDSETVQAQNGTLASSGPANVSLPGGLEASGNLTIDVETAGTPVTVNTTDKETTTFEGPFNSVTLLTGQQANDGQRDLSFDTFSGASDPQLTVRDTVVNQSLILIDVDTGEVVGSGRSDGSGTVTFTISEPGQHTVKIENFTIEIRDVETGELINNVTAEVRFFEEDGQTVFVRNSSSGVIETQTLPANQSFSITANAPGFVQRQSFIPDPRLQQTIFLLNDSSPSNIVRFSVEDRTGNFQNDVRIKISRAVDEPGSPADQQEYQVIAGDSRGAQLSFETTLQSNVRYRVAISNTRGKERQLGSFLIKTDQQIDLVISGISLGFTQEDDTVQTNVTQSLNETSGDKTVRAVLQDPKNQTTDVTVEVVPFSNESNVLDVGSTQGPVGTFSFETTITGGDADKRLLAKITFTRDGQTVTRTVPFGSGSFELLPGLASEWAQIFGVGFLLVLGGVFSVGNARIGAVLIPGVALVLTIGGVLNTVVAPAAVGLAFALAVGINIANSSQGIFR